LRKVVRVTDNKVGGKINARAKKNKLVTIKSKLVEEQ